MSLVLTAGHPFFKHAKPWVTYLTGERPSADDGLSPEQRMARYGFDWRKGWLVKWRDFGSVLQDALFNTKAEAIAFAATVNRPPLVVDDSEDPGYYQGQTLAELDAYWHELDVETTGR